MAPREDFIAVIMTGNTKHGALHIERDNRHRNALYTALVSEAVFMDGRDNGPAMTRLGTSTFEQAT